MFNKINLSEYGFTILQIESTAACNMACSFCPYPLKEDKSSKMNIEDIKTIINQVNPDDEKFNYVTFSQFNEPLLDRRIFELIEYVQSQGFKVLMITNGLLLNKEKNIQELLRLKPDLKISLQVIEDSTLKERGLNLEMEAYAKTIFDFCNRIKGTKLNTVLDIGNQYNNSKIKFYLKKFLGFSTGDPAAPKSTNETLDKFKIFLKKLNKIDSNYIDVSKIDELSKKQTESAFEFAPNNHNAEKGFKLAENIELKLKHFWYGRKIKDFYPALDRSFSCHNPILGIQADGNVVPCCLAYDDSISQGNIRNKSLKNMLENNEFLKNLRSKDGKKHITCRKCMGEITRRGVIFQYLRRRFNSIFS